MKKRHILLTLILFTSLLTKAQVPNGASLVGVHKVTTLEMQSIVGMDTGSLVYNLDSSEYCTFDGTIWKLVKTPLINKVYLSQDTIILNQGDSTFKVKVLNNSSQTLSISGLNSAWNTNSGLNATITLTQAATTLSISNTIAGSYGTLVVKQDATGARQLVLPSGSKVVNGGLGIVLLTSTPNAIDILSFYYDGTNYYWTLGNNFD